MRKKARYVAWAALEIVGVCLLFSGVDSQYMGYCWKCAVFLKRSTYFEFPLPHTFTEAIDGIDILRRCDPGPCVHEWIPIVENRHACGNLDISGHWGSVASLEYNGLFESASQVDPQGAADLARWILRYGLPWNPEGLLSERGVFVDGVLEGPLTPFGTREEFKDWASRLRGSTTNGAGFTGP